MPVSVKIDARDPEMSRIREVAQACLDNKLVVFPTETVYGVGGRMNMPGIVEKLNEVKGRPDAKPFSYHIADWGMLETLQVSQTPVFRFFARHFWPGPVTLVVKNISEQKIGVRFVKNRIACALINEVREPFIATSANQSGQASPHTAQQAKQFLDGAFDYLIDGGKTELSLDSTVVDISENSPVILRPGAHKGDVEKAVEQVKIGKFPRKKVLVICTGNTCRSPMAEGWLKHEFRNRGLSAQIEVSSCGMGTRDGLLASPDAELVMRNREIDISAHRSHLCRTGDLWGADLILVMGVQHAEEAARLHSSARSKTIVLDVADPIGMDMAVYEKTFLEVEKKIKQYMNEIIKLN